MNYKVPDGECIFLNKFTFFEFPLPSGHENAFDPQDGLPVFLLQAEGPLQSVFQALGVQVLQHWGQVFKELFSPTAQTGPKAIQAPSQILRGQRRGQAKKTVQRPGAKKISQLILTHFFTVAVKNKGLNNKC